MNRLRFGGEDIDGVLYNLTCFWIYLVSDFGKFGVLKGVSDKDIFSTL